MGKKAGMVFLGIFLAVAFTSSVWADSNAYTVVNGPKDFYYGHVSNIDGKEGPAPYILREDGAQRVPAVLNMPLMPGDSIVTPAGYRLEIQFDNGTILRLDEASEVKIETILAKSLTTSNKMTNLVLNRGQVYTMFKEYSSREIFQFIMPTAAVRLRHNSVAILGVSEDKSSDVRIRLGKANVLYGPGAKALKEQTVYKGERITIGPDHRYALQPFPEGTAFENWNISRNDNFETLHEGLSLLPKPIRRLPLAVQYFAEKYGNLYGEWIYDAYLGYVWRPADNDRNLGGAWQPYYAGQWTMAGNQMYWVPSEPWGWIPYHLGVWQWNSKRGWLWIPGSAFAPAWVDWAVFKGNYFAWRPYSLWNWMDGYPDLWAGGGYAGLNSNYPAGEAPPLTRQIDEITKNQLAYRKGPAYKMPRDYKGPIKALQAGLEKRDPEILAAHREQAGFGFVVSGNQLISPRMQDRAASLKTFSAEAEPVRIHSFMASKQKSDRTEVSSRPAEGRVFPSNRLELSDLQQPVVPETLREPETRIRDWNPDIRIAQRMGVSVRYDSASNRIYSPELRMQSGDRWGTGRMTSPRDPGGSGFIGSAEPGTSALVDRSTGVIVSARTTSGDDRSGESRGDGGTTIKK